MSLQLSLARQTRATPSRTQLPAPRRDQGTGAPPPAPVPGGALPAAAGDAETGDAPVLTSATASSCSQVVFPGHEHLSPSFSASHFLLLQFLLLWTELPT